MPAVSKPLTNCAFVALDWVSQSSSSWRSLLDSGSRSGSSNVVKHNASGLETTAYNAKGVAHGDRATGTGGDPQTIPHLVPQHECGPVPHRGAVPCEPLSDATTARGVSSPDGPAHSHARGSQTELWANLQVREPSGDPDPDPVGRAAGLLGDLHPSRLHCAVPAGPRPHQVRLSQRA